MFHQMPELPFQSPQTISVLIVHLLLAHLCGGQSLLITPTEPVVATIGDDIILPCHLEPAVDVAAKTLEWMRPDLDSGFIFVWRAGQDLVNIKNPLYKGRTSLFTGELKHGNISLKLSKVKPSDEGRYKCFVPDMETDSFIDLVAASGAVSSPVIDLAGIDRNRGGVVLHCESAGWYPEPEVFWLDGEGNLLSAGPTETIRGPDDLYTVSSRVTVEKRHSNNFTCRVQQKNINQTRETQICISDDFFNIQSSSSSAVPITVGLAVSLAVCILLILLFVFFMWRQNVIKTKRSHSGETDEGAKKKNEKREREQLMELERSQDAPDWSSSSQSSTTGHVFEVKIDREGKCIHLGNTSSKVQQLRGWTLQVKNSNNEPIIYTFEDIKLISRKTVILGPSGFHYLDFVKLEWRDLKSWSFGDKLEVVLFSNTGEIQHLSVHTY